MRDLTVVGGVPVDRVNSDEVLTAIGSMVLNGRATGRVHQIATVNVDFVINGIKDPSVLDILQSADLSIADGMPVVWGSRLLRAPLAERVTGADLVPMLAHLSARFGYRVVLFGGEPGVAETAAEILRREAPGADLTAVAAPYVADLSKMGADVIDEITAADADIVCVALGHPKQERWIQMYGKKVGAPVFIGVGGSLDFIAGTKSRAPRWVQNIGMEWTYRLGKEPRRLGKRYAACLRHFGPLLAADVWRMRPTRRSPRGSSGVRVTQPGSALRISASRSLHRDDVLAVLAGRPLGTFAKVTIDLSEMHRLDQSTVATVLALAHECKVRGVDLTIVTNDHLDSEVLPSLRIGRYLTGSTEPVASPSSDDDFVDLAETA